MDLEKIRAAAERVARSEGLEIVDVEWKVGRQRFLRVFIDRPLAAAGMDSPAVQQTASGGISHRECEAVSQQLSVILDVEELVPGPSYTLEVSSPGLDRKLVKPSDFVRFAGRRARISLTDAVENARFFEGRLAGVENEQVKMDVGGRVVALPIAWIRKANLVIEI